MTFCMKYDKRNRENLDKLAPNTRAAAYKWYEECIRLGADVLIYETIRTEEQQRKNVASGASQTMKSYHLVGQALDFVPIINNKDVWTLGAYKQEPFKSAIAYAKALGFTWGADWDNDGSTSDESFIDSPHLEFRYKGYGTDKVLEGSAPVAAPSKATAGDGKAIVPYPGHVLKRGSKGKDVQRIQRALGVEAVGEFGPQTEAAVKAYQKRKGLVADGVVGVLTWNMMF